MLARFIYCIITCIHTISIFIIITCYDELMKTSEKDQFVKDVLSHDEWQQLLSSTLFSSNKFENFDENDVFEEFSGEIHKNICQDLVRLRDEYCRSLNVEYEL